jgi:hypothetical protein
MASDTAVKAMAMGMGMEMATASTASVAMATDTVADTGAEMGKRPETTEGVDTEMAMGRA